MSPVRWIRLGRLCVLLATAQVVHAAEPIPTAQRSYPGGFAQNAREIAPSDMARMFQARLDRTVKDVAIGPDGVLRGRVLPGRMLGERQPGVTAGLRVKFLSAQRIVAMTTTDPRGVFAVQNLPQGLYVVAVEGTGTPTWRCYRLWPARVAPPQADREINLPLGAGIPVDVIVRGQRSTLFPIMSLRQAAVMGGVAAGAIAAPIIYHNARLNNKAPASR